MGVKNKAMRLIKKRKDVIDAFKRLAEQDDFKLVFGTYLEYLIQSELANLKEAIRVDKTDAIKIIETHVRKLTAVEDYLNSFGVLEVSLNNFIKEVKEYEADNE